MTGDLSVTFAAGTLRVEDLVVKGGSGNDSITLGDHDGVTVYGGAGNTITTTDNNSVLYGGAGNDKFDIAASIGNDDVVTIMDLSAGDSIVFAASDFNATAIDVSLQLLLLLPSPLLTPTTMSSPTSTTVVIPIFVRLMAQPPASPVTSTSNLTLLLISPMAAPTVPRHFSSSDSSFYSPPATAGVFFV